jgi:predicted acylesterase/phospholipase RssA
MTELVRYVCFEATGNASLTFRELYNFNGRELCIVVTNVSCMCEEYFHVKTTPDVEIAVALRMSTALPGLLQPVPSCSCSLSLPVVFSQRTGCRVPGA